MTALPHGPSAIAATPTADPEIVARQMLADSPSSAIALAQHLERHLSTDPLARAERVWNVSASSIAAMFGVSRQAYAKWKSKGVPADRAGDVRSLDEATRILLVHVRIDRIPAAVRRPVPSLGDNSLLDLALLGQLATVHHVVRDTFDLSASSRERAVGALADSVPGPDAPMAAGLPAVLDEPGRPVLRRPRRRAVEPERLVADLVPQPRSQHRSRPDRAPA